MTGPGGFAARLPSCKEARDARESDERIGELFVEQNCVLQRHVPRNRPTNPQRLPPSFDARKKRSKLGHGNLRGSVRRCLPGNGDDELLGQLLEGRRETTHRFGVVQARQRAT
jgi:hypothetical protein